MSPKVKPISSEITDKLNYLSYKERHDPFILKRFEQLANNILAKQPSNAYKILGAVATLSKNINELRYNHEMALQYSTNLTEDYYNYAISLTKLGFLTESIINSKLCFEYNHAYLENLVLLIENYNFLGDFRNSMKYLKNWNKLKPNEKYKDYKLITDAYEFTKKSSLKQNVLMDFIEGILQIFQKNSIFIQTYGLEIIETDNGDKAIKFNYLVDVEYEQLLDIEDKIYDNLLQSPQEIQKNILIDLDTEDPRLEEFLIYLNNYEKKNKASFKKVDSDKMDYIGKLVQVDY